MNASDELAFTDSLSSIWWLQILGGLLECFEMSTKVDSRNVHDDVEESNRGTRIVNSLSLG